ncbi:LysM peptidoglycan-binding domain-containing protein [Vibrio parahaemolyticus]|nr:LysM peptidoglycan-binding domain-containing protein [Vibrio parahaemolyticus]
MQPGDTLSEIALKFYGDGTRESYMKIARANGIENPDLIRVGQRLQIPR